MRKLLFCLMLTLVASVPFTFAAQKTTAKGKEPAASEAVTPLSLLNESYNTAAAVTNPDSRAPFLYRLMDLAQHADLDPATTKKLIIDWSTEAFDSSFKMTVGSNRIAAEKNALTLLSAVDPERAMQLFSRIEAPQPREVGGKLGEDVRAWSLVTIGNRYYKKVGWAKGKDLINQAILQTANTGEFPYLFAGDLIADLSKSSNEQDRLDAQNLFATAWKYAGQGWATNNGPRVTCDMLYKVKPALANTVVYHQFLDGYIQMLKQDSKLQGMDSVSFIVPTGQGDLKFTDENKLLLFRTFQLVWEIDPQWAKTLAEQDPTMKHVDITGPIHGSYVSEGTDPAAAAKFHEEARQEQILRDLQAATDPAKAESLLPQLTIPNLHAVGLSTLVRLYAGLNSSKGKGAYQKLQDELSGLGDPTPDNLILYLTWAKAAYAMHDMDEFNSLSSKLLSASIEIYNQKIVMYGIKNPSEVRPDTRRGYNELSQLISFSVSKGEFGILKEVRALVDPELKSYLLLEATTGLVEYNKHKKS